MRNVLAASIALVALFAANWAGAAPFAMVTDLKGEAWAIHGAQPRKLALLAYIEAPTEIRIDPAGKVAVTYFTSGMQYSFAGPARLVLGSASPNVIEGQQGESRKVTPEKGIGGGLSPDQWRRLQQATVVMRTVRPSFSVVGPDKTIVLDLAPEFEWTALPNAKGYRLVVYAIDNEIVHEATTEQNALRPGALSLQAGKRYRWKVDALGVQKPVSTSGSFAVADEPSRQQMLALKASAGNDPAARAFFATALEAQGNAHDARSEWKALAREYPDEPEFRQRSR